MTVFFAFTLGALFGFCILGIGLALREDFRRNRPFDPSRWRRP